jgi:hypothetical protein
MSIRFSEGLGKLLRLFLLAGGVAHWIGCFNFLLVRLNDFPEDSWVVFAGLQEQSIYSQWTWSFFKALCQMILIGFESPPFTNTSCDTTSHWCQIEHWTTLGCLYLGAVFYSILIASIHSILQSHNIASRRFDDRLRNLDGFLRREKLPKAERKRIKDDFIRRHAKRHFYSEIEVVQDIAPHRMQAIRWHRAQELAEKHPLFTDGRNAEFLWAMAQVMERTIYCTEEAIFTEQSHGDRLYFVSRGMVDLYREPAKSQFWILTHGESFVWFRATLL